MNLMTANSPAPSRSRLSLVLVALLAVACGRGTGDLEQWVAEIKAQKSSAIEPIPQMQPYEAFAYVPADRPDPFASIEPERQETAGAGSGLRPDINRNKEPLEEFPLDSLRMVGTISAAGRMFAMVKAPDGVIHRVALRDHLGQNYGEITAVSEAEVSLVELVPDGFGGWVQRPANLALAQ